MTFDNEMKLTVTAMSRNEGFARSVVGAFCTQLNPTLEQLDDIKTAVSEAVTNCVVHAYDKEERGNIEIFCGAKKDTVQIEITDYGKGIEDVEQAMRPFFTTVDTGERSGMGFAIMQAFCDDLKVTSRKGKTTVTMVKDFGGKAVQ